MRSCDFNLHVIKTHTTNYHINKKLLSHNFIVQNENSLSGTKQYKRVRHSSQLHKVDAIRDLFGRFSFTFHQINSALLYNRLFVCMFFEGVVRASPVMSPTANNVLPSRVQWTLCKHEATQRDDLWRLSIGRGLP